MEQHIIRCILKGYNGRNVKNIIFKWKYEMCRINLTRNNILVNSHIGR